MVEIDLGCAQRRALKMAGRAKMIVTDVFFGVKEIDE